MTKLTQADLDVLTKWDTPTICNALEIVAPGRRTVGFTTRPMVCADPTLKPAIGYARTCTIRAVTPPTSDHAKQKRMAYYEYVAADPKPTIVVIQDIDPHPGFGAFWGEVQSNVHKGLGCRAGVTNGTIRDLDMLAPGFQLLAGAVGPSHAWVHVVDFAAPVNVFGMSVHHNDLIHCDRHGAVVVPAEVVKEIPNAIDLLERREAVVLNACKDPNFGIEMLRKAIEGQAEIH